VVRSGGDVVRAWKDSMNPMEPKQPRLNNMPFTSMKSYAEAVKHDHTMKGKEIEVPLSGKNGSEAPVASVTLQTAKWKTNWLDHLWVGRLKNRGMFERAVDEVQEVVGMEVKVSYWGDDMIILHDMDEAKADKINLREQSNGETPLYSIQKWTPELKPEFRLIWIHIWGVPLEIWDAEHFATLLSTFGEIIELDEETADRSRLDVARVLIRTKEKPIFSKSMVAMVNETEHHLFLREEVSRAMGKRQRWSELEAFPPSPFTTTMEDSDEDLTTRIPDGASSEYLGDGCRRRWTKAINLWRAESEAFSDDDVSSHHGELLPAVDLPSCSVRQEDHNGPLIGSLHASGREVRRFTFPGQKQTMIEEKGDEGPKDVDTVKGAVLRAFQHGPEDITSELCPAVKPNSNLSIKEICGSNNNTQNRGMEGVMQDLGLNTNGPVSKGEETAYNLKVYSREKVGAGRKSLGHTNRISKTRRDDNKPSPLDLANSGPIHMEDDLLGGVDAADVVPIPPQTCLSPIPSSSFINVLAEAEEDFHHEVARHLGLTFDEHKASFDNMKTVKDISETVVASPAMMGRDNLAS